MAKLISIQELSQGERMLLLQEIGYNSDGVFVLELNGKKLIDKYINEPVKIDNMFIYPGSTIILDNNPLSISSFLEEYGDVL